MLKLDNVIEPEKPSDWPQNGREAILSIVDDLCTLFIREPSFINKERLIAYTTFDNDCYNYNAGTFRVTDYEVALINSLYIKFSTLGFCYGIVFLYELIWMVAHQVKIINMVFVTNDNGPANYYRDLLPHLYYFYWVAFFYFSESKRNLADELIYDIDYIGKSINLSPEVLARVFNTVLLDLSGKCSNGLFKEFDFSRIDIKKLFSKSSELMKNASIKLIENPHKSVLSIAISNFILRSRHDYEFHYVYKCVTDAVAEASFENDEFWMRRKSKLNDKREGKVIREVFANRGWIKVEWAKTMKFTFQRESFTCSFSKLMPGKMMKKRYGNCAYGYQSDSVGPTIATLIKTNKTFARLSQYIVYDVLYSRDEFKEEMNYLFSIIDGYYLSDGEKRLFLEEIIDYWKLTVKDKKWEYEAERRYEIMHFNDYTYLDCQITDEFLKNKTPLLLYPDFFLGESRLKNKLLDNVIEKTHFESIGGGAVICRKCLAKVFSYTTGNKCAICGSEEFLFLKG